MDEDEVEAQTEAEAGEAGVLAGMRNQPPSKLSKGHATRLVRSKLPAVPISTVGVAAASLLLNSSILLALQSYSSSMMRP